jgi:TolB-like protein
MMKLMAAVIFLTVLAGCANSPPSSSYYSDTAVRQRAVERASEPGRRIIEANYQAIDRLNASLALPFDPVRPILVTTIVDIDRLESSSTIGRVIASNAVSRLNSFGFKVIQLESGKTLKMNKEGATFLSRDIQNLVANNEAQAIIVGTYAASQNSIIVHLEVISNNDILAAVDYEIPRYLVTTGGT